MTVVCGKLVCAALTP
ncbi:hypothetical protein QO219_22150 [Vibrio vulnificus]|nr:hypothetical protein [Vibrio vulnificus]MCU8116132.1 hypothetical protein [Vibrio vulnificus]MCU8177561.1 hypothetical protein [Vibrio vulnificus]MCU8203368.1 hypothetical protein [Vibrio vulnificus]MCU8309032.1 hypothetical protein [Vibrio vulnificus]MCU8352562.1 hypothetical protein [Vibrio vulnificus]